MNTKKLLTEGTAALFGAALLYSVTLAEPAAGSKVQALDVAIREWSVPTSNSNPHDPAVAPDGSLWWTGQSSNRLGRLDPATGIMREYPLKSPNTGPHGLAFDREGNVWYTGNYSGLIGKLDPRTGNVSEYKMPDSRASDPHTPVFDQQEILWFTVQGGNFVGRLDPRTGKIDLKRVPTEDALPYGMVITSKGVPIFCEFGTNKLAKIDPKSMEITEYNLPEKGTRPRRIAIAKDDTIYFTDFEQGRLGRFNPATGEVKMWPSPGGPQSSPYGIAVTPDGMVWYSEAGVLPKNTIVRFDPKTETFASTTIPSGGGVFRTMAATPDGRVYIACSGVNKVGVVMANQARVTEAAPHSSTN